MNLILILVDGLVYAAWLFIVAVGLTLIFGVMRVLNMAHGSLYALGAYVAATLIGRWSQTGLPDAFGFVAVLAASLVVGLVMGLVLERGLLRRLHGHDEVAVALATFAVFLMLEDVMLLVWGVDAYPAFQLYGVLGTSEIGPLTFNNYDLSMIAVAASVGLALRLGLSRTVWGRLLRVVIHDRETAEAMGIDVKRVYSAVFVLGAALGALGGAYSAPMISVAPGIAVDVVILAFAVVVIGGLGSIAGALVGALAVGFARAAAVHLTPGLELFVIYAIMTLVLLVRPQGLFAQAAPRRI